MSSRREFLAAAAGMLSSAALAQGTPDLTLRIGEISLDLGPKKKVRTTAYNGQCPGPLLRLKEGKLFTVEVQNDTDTPEMVHWHGFHISPEVDGAHEEGTPHIMGRSTRRYSFVPTPAGTRWYHTHAIAGQNLKIGTYSGQFGMVVIEAREEPGNYDLEVPIVLHEWEPFFSPAKDGHIDYRTFSINGKMLGAGEPIRVRKAQRALFRLLNASASLKHRLALPHHTFQILAMDGNALKAPKTVPVIEIGPGERVDAVVEMTSPGNWILGETDAAQRTGGAGIVVEYAGTRGPAQWVEPEPFVWDYSAFGQNQEVPSADATIPLVFEPQHDGHLYSINGKSYPDTDPIRVREGSRTRLIFDNRSDEEHPMHLHRHTFEVVKVAGKAMSGVFKDVVMVPARKTVEVDVVANHPGPSLFHCHQQFHMDHGFMAVMRYTS